MMKTTAFDMHAGSSTFPGARPKHPPRAIRHQPSPDIPELWAVMLPRYGEGHILGPGQLVPIWDIAKWQRTDVPFELQGCFATLSHGALVCEDQDHLIADLEAIRCLAEQGLTDFDLGQRRARDLASRSILGGVGGLCTIRPDLSPSGMLPFHGKHGLDGPCIEIQPLSALEFHTATHSFPRTLAEIPEIRFYAASSRGDLCGWDVRARADVWVVSLPELPCSFMTAQELKLTRPDDPTGDYLRYKMLAAVWDILEFRGLTKGLIYAGFEMGPTNDRQRVWTTADIGHDLELPMYVLPYVDDPLISLNPGVQGKVRAMIQGDFSRPPAARTGILSR